MKTTIITTAFSTTQEHNMHMIVVYNEKQCVNNMIVWLLTQKYKEGK